MSNLSRGDIAALMLAFAVVAGLGGCQKETPKSSPVVEFKQDKCVTFTSRDQNNQPNIDRCYDDELHVYVYVYRSYGVAVMPEQWTYRKGDEQDPNQTQK